MNDILERLRNGESAENIAAEFSKALTTAEKTYNEERERKVLIENIFNSICKYCTLSGIDVSSELDVNEITKTLDHSIALMKAALASPNEQKILDRFFSEFGI